MSAEPSKLAFALASTASTGVVGDGVFQATLFIDGKRMTGTGRALTAALRDLAQQLEWWNAEEKRS